jgi:hypothetical protein
MEVKMSSQQQSQIVTAENFARAESDLYFASIVKDGGFGKFHHRREPTPIDNQTVIRMNRDTLLPDSKNMLGTKDQVDPVRFLIGSAMAWGGNPEKEATYPPVLPAPVPQAQVSVPELIEGEVEGRAG